jgi:hypothetical protein
MGTLVRREVRRKQLVWYTLQGGDKATARRRLKTRWMTILSARRRSSSPVREALPKINPTRPMSGYRLKEGRPGGERSVIKPLRVAASVLSRVADTSRPRQ